MIRPKWHTKGLCCHFDAYSKETCGCGVLVPRKRLHTGLQKIPRSVPPPRPSLLSRPHPPPPPRPVHAPPPLPPPARPRHPERVGGQGGGLRAKQRGNTVAWPARPVATGCQGNPCSTGIRWKVSPAAQMGCLRNRRGSPPGGRQGPAAQTPHQHQQPPRGAWVPPTPPMVPPARPSVPLHHHFAQQEQWPSRRPSTPQGGRPGDRPPSGPAGPLRSYVKG